MMVTGESGLGKTTFINTLFNDTFKPTKERKLFAQSFEKPLESWEKTAKIELREAIYEEDKFPVKFTVIDTPGFGDYSNNNNSWVPIVNYIESQHRMYMLQEEQPYRQQISDTRVHVCLYFIRPNGHGLLPLDIKVMQELCHRVNLIPIISKADSLTPEDTEHFKNAVRAGIEENNISVYKPTIENGYDRQDDVLELEDIAHMPFAIVSSEDTFKLDSGDTIRGRNYRWGLVEIENTEHCDFVRLRRVLMSGHMLDLIDCTVERHYEAYRQKTMSLRIEKSQKNEKNGEITENSLMISQDGGLQALRVIWKYGREFLEALSQENNAVLQDRKEKVEQQLNLWLHFQEHTFREWSTDLEAQRLKLEGELNLISRDIRRLKEELSAMALGAHAAPLQGQGRYAIKK